MGASRTGPWEGDVRSRGGALALMALAIAASACSDDDSADPTTTVAVSTIAAPGTTAVASTTSPPPTTTVVTTTPPSDGKPDDVATDNRFSRRTEGRGDGGVPRPRCQGLRTAPEPEPRRTSTPRSRRSLFPAVRMPRQLVDSGRRSSSNNGQYIVPNDPSIESLTVESIDARPATDCANVTACQVSNAMHDQDGRTSRRFPAGRSRSAAPATSTRLGFTQTLVLTARRLATRWRCGPE